MDVRSLGFPTDLMVLSLGGSTVRERDDHLVVRTPSNPTFWWGNFVLFAEPVEQDDVPRLLALYAAELPARFQVVETRPEARRRGLASALVHHAGQAAFERGVRRLVIVADPEYHAIGIYGSLGFVAAEQQVQLIRRPAAA
jgi:GNAT superfamily N-acetyltransferase